MRTVLGRGSATGAALAAVAVALSLTTTVLATPTTINDVDLTAGGGAVFDPEHETYGCVFDEDTRYYSPIGDGSIGIRTDGFDGALVLWVGDNAFTDADGVGNLVGQQLTVGPTKVSGVKVTRIERALPGSRTLRSLIKLTNPSKKILRRSITLDTNLGSDGSTALELSSSGDIRFDSRDRWGITSEQPGSDPVVTMVNYGKGRVVRPQFQIGPVAGDECILTSFRITLGPKQTRYMMFFVELSEDDLDAASSARKFNRKRLSSALLAGLGSEVRQRILDWDLT
ncbi:MAG TPA: hypothetical protein VF097_12415 [Actinomycetota bacterium]